MMTVADTELLRRYARDRSEADFTELVRRHVDLVYSAALRQVGGNASLAEDITQTVFVDLARKARVLARHTSLTGWLYTSTRFAAASVRRSEQRRRAREEVAHTMNQILNSPDSEIAWRELQPVLDDAMHRLSDSDREAVLLRFFERLPLAEIGIRLGLSENAARMRVDRALEKLRVVLSKRGVTSTVAGLAALLSAHAVVSAPGVLTLRISQAAIGTAAGSGLTFVLLQIMTTKTKIIAASIAVATLTSSIVWYEHGKTNAPPPVPSESVAAPATPEQKVQTAASESAANAGQAVAGAGTLQLSLVAADNNQPLSDARIEYRGWEGPKFSRREFRTDGAGVSQIPVRREAITKIELTTRVDGFSDKRVQWSPERGETIPASYVVRLTRATPIGGRVLDADGQPVVAAKVGFNHEEGSAPVGQTESHEFGWIEVSTDPDGRWSIDRIAPEMIRRLYGSASHPDYVNSPMIWVGQIAEAEKQLREGTHVFTLGRAVAIRGVVVNGQGTPVPGAKILVGNIGEGGRRETTALPDGTFYVGGCKPGKNLLTASASGYAATTLRVDLALDSAPFKLVLQSGKVLRLRVVDKGNQPVPGANVWLDTMNHGPLPSDRAPVVVQAECCGKTDSEGRVVWENAPDAELDFDFYARGFMRVSDVKIKPDGEEHVITLPPALTVSGTATDEKSGEPIQRFRMGTGWPTKAMVNGVFTNSAQWSTLERFWMNFSAGEFKHTFEEPVIHGTTNLGYIFKFEAEGYAPFVSRTVAADEGEARLTVKLQPAVVTKVSVKMPDGRPAAAVDVGLATATTGLTIRPGGFDRRMAQSGGAFLVTDAEGQFNLPPDEGIIRVIVSCPDGFADTPTAAVKANPVIQIRPWGRIEGTWVSGGKPAADRELKLDLDAIDAGSVRLDFEAFRIRTDAQGKFTFAKAPPGKLQLVRLIPNKNPGESFTSFSHQPLKDVEVVPGETTTVSLGGSSVTVSARLRWPAGLQRADGWRVMGAVSTPTPQPPPEILKNPDLIRQWAQRPEFQALMRGARHYQFVENADGTFTAEDVEPGNYVLRVNVISAPVGGGQSALRALGETTITVQSGGDGGKLDVGEIALRPAAIP